MATQSEVSSHGIDEISKSKIWKVIGASSTGTVIEWYDFYIFGSLATVMSPLFYPPGNDTLALIAFLATFAVGFVVRPFGAIFFGRIGDLVGRKYAFLVTLLLMGGATAAVGFLPTYSQIGMLAPILLILIRVLQGLALGGEYGGAVVYVAEHVPDEKRGFYTSFIQITASFGLLISLAVVIGIQSSMSKETFAADGFWAGWRIPFLISILLIAVSLYMRLKMQESPIFTHIKTKGLHSAKPLVDAFANPENRRRVLITLFGATAGQGVVWYTGQFYALFYMETILKIERIQAAVIIACAIALALPLFVVFGKLSDKIGRKRIIMAGLLAAVICYFPLYKGMVYFAGNDVQAIQSTSDRITGKPKLSPVTGVSESSGSVGTPVTSAPNVNVPMMIFLVFIQVLFVTMVYAPIAAYLVEAFPAKIRYTSMSLPYHIGNGVFGGLLPTVGLIACAWTGNIYAGLAYPMIIAGATFMIGWKYLPDTHGHRIWAEVEK
ncbi:MAG: MHS family MFS transporter [Pyrinomonadaceae bacterium]|nr:MHS family MFS transporter [Pyrinomonadaceae bacterium]